MIDTVLIVLSSIVLVIGAFFVVVGAIGIWRFPDFYSRLHGAGVTDTLGAELIIFGLILQTPVYLDGLPVFLITAKLLIIALFLFFTSPTSTHAIANAAHTAGLKPFLGAAALRKAQAAEQSADQKEGSQ